VTNHCGSCTACCRIFDIPELEKPAGKWCQHCDIGKGCKVYESRPSVCREFKCLWLLSQDRVDWRERLGPELRPDKCKVVLSPSTNENIIAATTMPGAPLAWKEREIFKIIKIIASGNMAVVCGAPLSTDRTMVTKDGMHAVRMTPPDENGVQWNVPQ
jgi:hypothetical protein